MDYKKIFNTMVRETAMYLMNNNISTMVLGVSGGLDSTVTAAICHEVVNGYKNQNFRFIGVSLPCSSNTDTENDSAMECLKAFCKDGDYWTENLQKEYLLMKATCEQHTESTHISQGNIKARLRMIYLYNLASTMNGIVMDTDNLTEHYLGFFTIHGDVADYNPIGGLWKHEVYELAKYIKSYYEDKFIKPHISVEKQEELVHKINAIDYAIKITPTDGNGVNDLGDMGQIAPEFANDINYDAYRKVDEILDEYINVDATLPNAYSKYSREVVDNIIKRCKNTNFKRHKMPIVIERSKYN